MPKKRDFSAVTKVSKTLNRLVATELEMELERDVRLGMKPKDLRDKYLSRVTAKSILIALTGSEKSANSAIRDLTDRQEGRPLEKKEVRHHLEKLSDKEIDAMLLTEIDDLRAADEIKKNNLQ